MKKLLSAIGVGTVLTLALAGCGGSPETPEPAPEAVETDGAELSDFDALVEAAKAEGSLRVYAQIPEPPLLAYAEAFKEKYGINVEALRLGGNTLSSRFDTETEAGTPSGELLIATDIEFLASAAGRGDLLGFSEVGVKELFDGFPEASVLDDYDAPVVQALYTGFVYNTDDVAAADLPKSWSDLSDARWAGNFCAVDPSTSLSMAQFMWTLRDEGGDAVLSTIGANIGRWYPNVVALNEAVAVGECQLGLNSAEFMIRAAQRNGAPVDFATGPSGVYPVVSASVATEAEHPNAARLFLHFILAEENTRILSDPADGSFGPWDYAQFPPDFWVPQPSDFQVVRDQTPELLALLGL